MPTKAAKQTFNWGFYATSNAPLSHILEHICVSIDQQLWGDVREIKVGAKSFGTDVATCLSTVKQLYYGNSTINLKKGWVNLSWAYAPGVHDQNVSSAFCGDQELSAKDVAALARLCEAAQVTYGVADEPELISHYAGDHLDFITDHSVKKLFSYNYFGHQYKDEILSSPDIDWAAWNVLRMPNNGGIALWTPRQTNAVQGRLPGDDRDRLQPWRPAIQFQSPVVIDYSTVRSLIDPDLVILNGRTLKSRRWNNKYAEVGSKSTFKGSMVEYGYIRDGHCRMCGIDLDDMIVGVAHPQMLAIYNSRIQNELENNAHISNIRQRIWTAYIEGMKTTWQPDFIELMHQRYFPELP